ncbi:brachyurin-like [Lutzomyia longipalpis]|uniref:Peptidase S1 domain-containing protein n=2 Tax=Lutzomyia longipalpis TaxID=7200 RepID=A0A1B0GH14_LUTLO|nr:brachyurin-like [Lutzomyia longipalpis]
MKTFIVLCVAVFALAAASQDIEIDWSTVRPLWEVSTWQDAHPKLMEIVRARKDMPKIEYGPAGRIVGGTYAQPHQFPYQVGLILHMDGGNSFCGGSLLSRNYAMTAAHCLDVANSAIVILGAHHIFDATEPTQQRILSDGSSFRLYPNWDASLVRNDLATLRLNTPADYIPGLVHSVRLPNFRQAEDGVTFAGQLSSISGWGRFNDSSNDLSPTLRYVRLPIMTNLACTLRWPGIIQPSNICADGANGGPCNGDSGGPVSVIEADGITTQVGVVSFGLALGCELNWPSAHARTTSFIQWIDDNTDHEIRENW